MYVELTPIDKVMEKKLIARGAKKISKDTYMLEVTYSELTPLFKDLYSIEDDSAALRYRVEHHTEYYYNQHLNCFIAKYE